MKNQNEMLRSFIDTRDVIHTQVAQFLATTEISAKSKVQMSNKINQILTVQFNQLIDRVQASL